LGIDDGCAFGEMVKLIKFHPNPSKTSVIFTPPD
jgi:hypothetical protein